MRRLLSLILLAASCAGAQSITVAGTPSSGNGCTEASGGPRTMALTPPGTGVAGGFITGGVIAEAYTITAASWAATSGGQATFTINTTQIGSNEYAASDIVDVVGMSPSGYNSDINTGWTVVSVTSTTVVVTMPSNPGSATVFGQMMPHISTTDNATGGSNTYTNVNEVAITLSSFQDPIVTYTFFSKNIALHAGENPNMTVDTHHSNGFIGAWAIIASGVDTSSPLDLSNTLTNLTNFTGPWPSAQTPGNFNIELYVAHGPGDGVKNGVAARQGVTFTEGGTGCFQGWGYAFFVSSSGFPSPGLGTTFTETGGAFPNQSYVSSIASFKATGATGSTPGSTVAGKSQFGGSGKVQ